MLSNHLTNAIEELVIENAGQSFKGNDFRDLLRPGVYVLFNGEQVLYVGRSNRLLGRVGGKHHRQTVFDECTEVRIFPCKSDEAAKKLEGILITFLKPSKNFKRSPSFVAQMLGVTRLRA